MFFCTHGFMVLVAQQIYKQRCAVLQAAYSSTAHIQAGLHAYVLCYKQHTDGCMLLVAACSTAHIDLLRHVSCRSGAAAASY